MTYARPPLLVLASTTFYPKADQEGTPDHLRANLALDTVRAAEQCGYQIVVVDGGSHEKFLVPLKQHGNVTLLKEVPHLKDEMGPGRRQALAKAGKIASRLSLNWLVGWMEPEKAPLVWLLAKLLADAGCADLIIPARTAAGFASYPRLQAMAEQLGNACVEKMIGQHWDLWFGPMVLSPAALEIVLAYNGKPDLWDATLAGRFDILKAGLKIVCVEVDYIHPAAQTAAEESDLDIDVGKRIIQLAKLVPTFLERARMLGLTAS